MAPTSSLGTGETEAFLSLTPAWSTSQCQAGQGCVIKLIQKKKRRKMKRNTKAIYFKHMNTPVIFDTQRLRQSALYSRPTWVR